MSNTRQFDSHSFHEEIVNSNKPVLVDFWAPWCGPCRLVAPTIDEVSREIGDRAIVGKLNIDEHAEAASQFSVSAIPSVLVFKDGQVVDRLVGVQPANVYLAALERAA